MYLVRRLTRDLRKLRRKAERKAAAQDKASLKDTKERLEHEAKTAQKARDREAQITVSKEEERNRQEELAQQTID